MDNTKEERSWALIRSVLLCAAGLLFIALGLSFLPVIGIAIGAGLPVVWALSLGEFLHRKGSKCLLAR